MLYLLS